MFIRNINKFSSILHPSSRLSNRFYNFFAKGNRESPTKILLLAGEGIHENMYDLLLLFFLSYYFFFNSFILLLVG